MARLPRVVAVGVAHHVTQRGNARQVIFANDADRAVYLELLRKHADLYQLSVLGYCLMSNHVHLIVVPNSAGALAQSLKQAHGRYASYWNTRQSSTGHVWQGRFYSCPLDESHLWKALRYVELNPVRAGMVGAPELWNWSSATAHCGLASPHPLLALQRWSKRWLVAEWRAFLDCAVAGDDCAALRQSTHTGRPLGSPEFVTSLEERMQRILTARKGGRPKASVTDSHQSRLTFVA